MHRRSFLTIEALDYFSKAPAAFSLLLLLPKVGRNDAAAPGGTLLLLLLFYRMLLSLKVFAQRLEYYFLRSHRVDVGHPLAVAVKVHFAQCSGLSILGLLHSSNDIFDCA